MAKRDNANFLRINIAGNRGNTNHVVFEAYLEKASNYISDDMLKWEPLPDTLVKVQPNDGIQASMLIHVPYEPDSGEYRLVIKEYEKFSRMTEDEIHDLPHEKRIKLTEEDSTGRRIVYSDVFEVNELLK